MGCPINLFVFLNLSFYFLICLFPAFVFLSIALGAGASETTHDIRPNAGGHRGRQRRADENRQTPDRIIRFLRNPSSEKSWGEKGRDGVCRPPNDRSSKCKPRSIFFLNKSQDHHLSLALFSVTVHSRRESSALLFGFRGRSRKLHSEMICLCILITQTKDVRACLNIEAEIYICCKYQNISFSRKRSRMKEIIFFLVFFLFFFSQIHSDCVYCVTEILIYKKNEFWTGIIIK